MHWFINIVLLETISAFSRLVSQYSLSQYNGPTFSQAGLNMLEVFSSVTLVFTDRITWLVSGLLYELEVQLVAKDLLVQALWDDKLHKGDGILLLHLKPTASTPGRNAWTHAQ